MELAKFEMLLAQYSRFRIRDPPLPPTPSPQRSNAAKQSFEALLEKETVRMWSASATECEVNAAGVDLES